MNAKYKTTRVLGVAFMLQFVTSIVSGFWAKPSWLVEGDISATMLKIADQPGLLRVNILLDMLTALGVIFLGAILYITLRKQNEKMALVAMAFYILEGALLATSRIGTFSLLRLSQEFVIAGQPDYFLTLGNIAIESMDFVGEALHMLAFCIGGILFYYLLDKSRLVPRWLSLWGLVALIPLLFGTVAAILNVEFPLALYVPYVPFEFVIGLWILVKGIEEPATAQNMEITNESNCM